MTKNGHTKFLPETKDMQLIIVYKLTIFIIHTTQVCGLNSETDILFFFVVHMFFSVYSFTCINTTMLANYYNTFYILLYTTIQN